MERRAAERDDREKFAASMMGRKERRGRGRGRRSLSEGGGRWGKRAVTGVWVLEMFVALEDDFTGMAGQGRERLRERQRVAREGLRRSIVRLSGWERGRNRREGGIFGADLMMLLDVPKAQTDDRALSPSAPTCSSSAPTLPPVVIGASPRLSGCSADCLRTNHS